MEEKTNDVLAGITGGHVQTKEEEAREQEIIADYRERHKDDGVTA